MNKTLSEESLLELKTKYQEYFENMETKSLYEIKKFSEKLVERPSHTLEWSATVFNYAAELEISRYLIDFIKSDDFCPFKLEEFVLKQTIQEASSITNKSTGIGSNLMKEARVEERSSIYDYINKTNMYALLREEKKSQAEETSVENSKTRKLKN